MTGVAAPLINLLGFTTGAILYAMLLWMVLRSSADRLSLLTGVLGLFWNIGAFFAYGLFTMGLTESSPVLLAMAFSALGFLPAVVVHSVLRSRGMSGVLPGRAILILSYGLSFLAAALHIRTAIWRRVTPSQPALQVLTIGFVLLMFALLASTRKQAGWGQSLWVMALAVFAVSTLHLSNHQGTDPWWLELIGHHASVPLALAFLHQDYRFALADIFLKRAVALLLLVTLVFAVYVTGIVPVSDQRSLVLIFALWVATALVYPWIRRFASWFVNNVVLHRPDYDMLLAEAARAAERHETVDAIFEDIREVLGPALSARSIQWKEVAGLQFAQNIVRVTGGRSAVAVIPTVEPPHYLLSIGELEGGRRLLSDDIAVIERLALLTARRIDAVRTNQERIERNGREREMSRLAAEAELRALRAQIHPHFLFNALTTIGYLIQAAPDRALATLMRLSSLLRSVLRASPDYSTLDEEIRIVSAYLEIERARFEDRLDVRINVEDGLRPMRVPALLIQALVENAIKHGISRSSRGGEVRISARLQEDDHTSLRLIVADTGSGGSESQFRHGRTYGVGLNNVEKRLKCYAEGRAGMRIVSEPGHGTRVEVWLPAESTPSQNDNAAIAETR
jgi:signal transduction histidine kinase